MLETRTDPPSPEISERGLRIVLFGMPDAGKTTLLGAMAQTAVTQDNKSLQGDLTDVGGGLSELREAVYENEPTRTDAEIVAYQVLFQPKDKEGNPTGPAIDAVFFDCDGRTANEFLSQQKDLGDSPDSELARAILNADTLILAVDISASAEVINRNFNQFVRFLRLLEQSRSRHSEINGLPVYLVLTKCDLLARSGDTLMEWMDRVEDRKRKVSEEFRSFLEKQSRKQNLPFGKVDLHVWATAKQKPDLGSNGAKKKKEPYQVAELLRQSLNSAQQYHQRRRKAQRRLHVTMALVAGLAGLMLMLLLFFVVARQGVGPQLLERQVRDYVTRLPEPPGVYQQWQDHLQRFQMFRANPDFAGISPTLQQEVNEQINRFEAYGNYKRELDAIIGQHGLPENINRTKTLEAMQAKLTEVSPPERYIDEWKQTAAGRKHMILLEDIRDIKATLENVKKSYEQIIADAQHADDLRAKGNFTEAVKKAKDTLVDAKGLTDPEANWDEYIPESPRITWATIARYPEVQQLLTDWRRLKPSLEKLAMIAFP